MIEPKITLAERVLAFLQGLAERADGALLSHAKRRLAQAEALEAAVIRLRKYWLGRS